MKEKKLEIIAILVSLLISVLFLIIGLYFNNRLIEKQLLRDLHNQDWRIRLKAAIKLSERKDEKFIRSLIPLLRDESPYIRNITSRLLCEMGSPVVLPLLTALKSPNEYMRANSAFILGKIKDPRSFEMLVTLLNEKKLNVLKTAIHSLGEINNPDASKFLLKLLNHSDRDIRQETSEALGKLKDVFTIKYLVELIKTDNSYQQYLAEGTLIKIGEPVAPYIIPLIHDKNNDIKRIAVYILGTISNDAAINALLRALQDGDESVRLSAAFELAENGDSRAVEVLIAALKNPDESVRSSVVETLGKMQETRALHPLINMLNDKNDDVRYYAVIALARLKDSTAIPQLIASLKKEDLVLKMTIISALGYLKDIRAGEPLLKIFNNDDEWIGSARWLFGRKDNSCWTLRHEAAQALGEIKCTLAIPHLIKAMMNYYPYIGYEAQEALVKIGSPSVSLLVKLLKDHDESIRLSAASALGNIKDKCAVGPLISALKDKDYNVQSFVIGALGEIGDNLAVKPLMTLMMRDDNYHVELAIEALGKIGDSSVIQKLIGFLEKGWFEDVAAEALINIGDDGIKALKEMIYDNDLEDDARFSIAAVFASSRNPELLATLDEALDSKDLIVIAGAYKYFIRKGIPGSEKYLIEALDYYRNSDRSILHICEHYAFSGNLRLEAAAYIAANDPAGERLLHDNDKLRQPTWGSYNISLMAYLLTMRINNSSIFFN